MVCLLDQYLKELTSLGICSLDIVNVLIRDCELMINSGSFGLIEGEVQVVPRIVCSSTKKVVSTAVCD